MRPRLRDGELKGFDMAETTRTEDAISALREYADGKYDDLEVTPHKVALVLAELERMKRDHTLEILQQAESNQRIREARGIRLEKVARDAIACWGVEAQTAMVIEELAETIVAISHYQRGRVPSEEVASEIADACITLAQLEAIIDIDARPFIEEKVARLEARIAKTLEARRAKGGE
jgi:NTP pyrophosphatase (non-canonical NTP hydrolase)